MTKTSKTYQVPTEIGYTVTAFGDPYTQSIRVAAYPGTYVEYTSREHAESEADSPARTAALMYYDEAENEAWKFGDEVTGNEYPSRPFWYIDSDFGGVMDVFRFYPNDSDWDFKTELGSALYPPYRFIGFIEKESTE